MKIGLCLSQSTAHGLVNIGNEKRTCFRAFWVMLTIATGACFVYHTHLLYSQLVDEQILITTDPNGASFLQPDILFCPDKFLARDYIMNPPKSDYEFMLNLSKEIQQIDILIRKMNRYFPYFIWDSLNLYKLYTAFYHRKYEFFLSIKCDQEDVNLNEITTEMNFVHFACFRLKPSACRLHSPKTKLVIKLYTHLHGRNASVANLNVRGKSLDFHPFIFTEFPPEIEDGVHLYFVQPNTMVNEGTMKVTASVNAHTIVRLKSTKFDRVSRKRFRCRERETLKEFYNLLDKNMSNYLRLTEESTCKAILYQEYLLSKFNCVLKQFPVSKEIPDNITFCGNLFKRTKYEKYLRYRNVTALVRLCRGIGSCTTIYHSATTNTILWPSTQILHYIAYYMTMKMERAKKFNITLPGYKEVIDDYKRDPSNVKSWKRNLIKITIAPGSSMSAVVKEDKAYSLKNFFSDIGGIIGFYLGASLLTLFEVVRLMQYTVASFFGKNKKDSKIEEHNLNEDLV